MRFYRRSKPKRRKSQVKRWWRTRKDPFADVWQEVAQRLEQTPHIRATTLFRALQESYPGQFDDGQLRTLQRRVKEWRIEQAARPSPPRGMTDSPQRGHAGGSFAAPCTPATRGAAAQQLAGSDTHDIVLAAAHSG